MEKRRINKTQNDLRVYPVAGHQITKSRQDTKRLDISEDGRFLIAVFEGKEDSEFCLIYCQQTQFSVELCLDLTRTRVETTKFYMDGEKNRNLLFVARTDNQVVVYDCDRNFDIIATMNGHYQPVTAIKVSKSASSVLFGSCEGKMSVWNLEKMTLIKKMRVVHSKFSAVEFLNDQDSAVAGGLAGELCFWNFREPGGKILRYHGGKVLDILNRHTSILVLDQSMGVRILEKPSYTQGKIPYNRSIKISMIQSNMLVSVDQGLSLIDLASFRQARVEFARTPGRVAVHRTGRRLTVVIASKRTGIRRIQYNVVDLVPLFLRHSVKDHILSRLPYSLFKEIAIG
mmetsp:Transcript_58251/g.66489  ORF Transcript_58251/g.66489 Transcript_58251/m.66489 type:complete len:343 (-) Transcript_58251:67-1095(-)